MGAVVDGLLKGYIQRKNWDPDVVIRLFTKVPR
jgi:hypothetical protein